MWRERILYADDWNSTIYSSRFLYKCVWNKRRRKGYHVSICTWFMETSRMTTISSCWICNEALTMLGLPWSYGLFPMNHVQIDTWYPFLLLLFQTHLNKKTRWIYCRVSIVCIQYSFPISVTYKVIHESGEDIRHGPTFMVELTGNRMKRRGCLVLWMKSWQHMGIK